MNPKTRRQRRQTRKWFSKRNNIIVLKKSKGTNIYYLEQIHQKRMRWICVDDSLKDSCWIWRTRKGFKRH